MSSIFDPYQTWLGIPPDEQPPHHYRLLGVMVFERDPGKIRDAARERISHVRKQSLSDLGDLSQRILNELADAMACLIDVDRKAAYDRLLCANLPDAWELAAPGRADESSLPVVGAHSEKFENEVAGGANPSAAPHTVAPPPRRPRATPAVEPIASMPPNRHPRPSASDDRSKLKPAAPTDQRRWIALGSMWTAVLAFLILLWAPWSNPEVELAATGSESSASPPQPAEEKHSTAPGQPIRDNSGQKANPNEAAKIIAIPGNRQTPESAISRSDKPGDLIERIGTLEWVRLVHPQASRIPPSGLPTPIKNGPEGMAIRLVPGPDGRPILVNPRLVAPPLSGEVRLGIRATGGQELEAFTNQADFLRELADFTATSERITFPGDSVIVRGQVVRRMGVTPELELVSIRRNDSASSVATVGSRRPMESFGMGDREISMQTVLRIPDLLLSMPVPGIFDGLSGTTERPVASLKFGTLVRNFALQEQALGAVRRLDRGATVIAFFRSDAKGLDRTAPLYALASISPIGMPSAFPPGVAFRPGLPAPERIGRGGTDAARAVSEEPIIPRELVKHVGEKLSFSAKYLGINRYSDDLIVDVAVDRAGHESLLVRTNYRGAEFLRSLARQEAILVECTVGLVNGKTAKLRVTSLARASAPQVRTTFELPRVDATPERVLRGDSTVHALTWNRSNDELASSTTKITIWNTSTGSHREINANTSYERQLRWMAKKTFVMDDRDSRPSVVRDPMGEITLRVTKDYFGADCWDANYWQLVVADSNEVSFFRATDQMTRISKRETIWRGNKVDTGMTSIRAISLGPDDDWLAICGGLTDSTARDIHLCRRVHRRTYVPLALLRPPFPDIDELSWRRAADGGSLVTARDYRKVAIWRLNADCTRHGKITEVELADDTFEWSPRSDSFAAMDKNGLQVFQFGSELVRKELEPELRNALLAWSPNGRCVAYRGGYKGKLVSVRDATTGDTLATFPVDGDVTALAWRSDAQRLAVGTQSGSIAVFNAPFGPAVKPVAEDEQPNKVSGSHTAAQLPLVSKLRAAIKLQSSDRPKFVEQLEKIIKTAPGSEVAKAAQLLLAGRLPQE